MFWKQSIRLYTENILDSKQWLKKTQIIVIILVIKASKAANFDSYRKTFWFAR